MASMIEGSLLLYARWCVDNKEDEHKDDSYYGFIQELQLQAFKNDPPEYPGLHHVVCLISAGKYRFEQMVGSAQENLLWGLVVHYADQHMATRS
jgi:hypothetical protein